MDQELTALIESIGSDSPPTDEALTEARDRLRELAQAELDSEDRDLEAATALTDAIDLITAEQGVRAEAAKADDEKAEALRAKLAGPEDEEESEEDESEEAEAPEVPEVKEEKLPVAASLNSALKRASARVTDETPEPVSDVRIRAVGAAQGWPLDHRSTLDDVAELFAKEARGNVKGALVHMEFEYPEERRLSSNSKDNRPLIEAVFSPQNMTMEAIGAAGGICGPLPADFTHPVCGDRGRPIRDGLARFNANRGGIRYQPAISLADLSGGVGVWTIETDESPGENTKDCLVLECEEELEAKVDAVYACVQIGNFQARFNPEFYRSRLDALMLAHDRLAEQTLYADIEAASTAVTFAGGDGSVYSVLAAIDKAIAGISSRHRLGRGAAYRAILPQWLHQAFRAQFARQRAFGLDQFDSVVDGYINRLFTSRNVTPIWSGDIEVYGTQNAGALLDYPGTNAEVTVFPEGTFMFLDGGTLDLGTDITDSTLNQTNDRQAFLETFEKVVKRGCESLTITVSGLDDACVCPEVEAA